MRIAVLGPLEVRTDTGRRWRCRAPRSACCSPSWLRGHRMWSAPTGSSRGCGTVTARRRPAVRCRSTSSGSAALWNRSGHGAPRGATSCDAARVLAGRCRRELDALSVGELVARGRALLAAGDAAGAAEADRRARPLAGRSVRATGRTRRSPRPSGCAWGSCAPVPSPRCSRPGWPWGMHAEVVGRRAGLLAGIPCGRTVAAAGARAVPLGPAGRCPGRARSAPGGCWRTSSEPTRGRT